MTIFKVFIFFLLGLTVAMPMATSAQIQHGASTDKNQRATALEARTILGKAKAKLQQAGSLIADYELSSNLTKSFDKQMEITLEKPNRFKVEKVTGLVVKKKEVITLSDGQFVSFIDEHNFITYEKPLRKDSF